MTSVFMGNSRINLTEVLLEKKLKDSRSQFSWPAAAQIYHDGKENIFLSRVLIIFI